MTFKPYEIAFLEQTDLGRLATVQKDGTPQNSPVGFAYNAELGTIDIGGFRMSKSQKYRNLSHNSKVALVVDDLYSRDPWRVRCLEIRGIGEQVPDGGSSENGMDPAIIRIRPTKIISFGIDAPDTPPHELTVDIRTV